MDSSGYVVECFKVDLQESGARGHFWPGWVALVHANPSATGKSQGASMTSINLGHLEVVTVVQRNFGRECYEQRNKLEMLWRSAISFDILLDMTLW